ncbi:MULTISPECIES: bifunctional diguanylate cyclase/phosphodiesterase [unclassified Beijerinckia]|uniref:putative bifunctional diguanylate cyclase/phosphodiesterase n=1 Tax=unclassified Beijerinckia TaxID=2638183 RepID=UPI000898540B|nr:MULTISPECIES: bifunctional diguanylate cyclase/phosphodiesterase [unclassified Beijerinckia]MDH7794912.1 diguanylate cyclase (GGDEF)-like protein [Beijerinckia sp. GAS462]SEB80167.1 diguanylate cyclase/phosphodiesterase [Beijerinckia sp. 28-YEA-48]
MMTVLSCITESHNIWLVLVAAAICVVGSWVTIRLFHRAATTAGAQRLGWHVLTSVSLGSTIWCTHFIAMLGFDPGVPIGFDPVLTIVSLLVAVIGGAIGLIAATSNVTRMAPVLGGAIVGLAIVAMHYTGMMGYRVQGLVSWNVPYLIASIVLSVVFAALTFRNAMEKMTRSNQFLAVGILVAAIVSLHFTAMTAFQVQPLLIDGDYSNPDAMQALALAIAGVAIVILSAGIASYFIDDSLRAESYERLRQMALVDSLTSLPNRASFNNWLEHEITGIDKAGGKLALIGIDLDRFKDINDQRGHSAGDQVLKVLGQRMNGLLRDGEFIARLGGDEFAAVQRMHDDEAKGDDSLTDFLARLQTALFDSISVDDFDVIAGASIGVALYPDNAADQATLINNADLAMYRAKADLGKVVCFYDQSMDETVRARRNLANDLREAMNAGQLDIHYQVQTSISTGQIQGYEALARWKHPLRGYISPAEFIPIAEENGLILQIGEWVLRTACSRAASWEPPYKVAVNISPVQFAHADLPKLVLDVLLETGLSPERLELELTESTIFTDKERSLHMLRQIKALGVGIALDDFGTGYSSLDTLRTFPFDKIKLDRSFMCEVESSPQAKAMVRAVLALGKSLEIPVLAEGIETQGQLTLLTSEGCDEAQGYLLGRPVPLTELVGSGQLTLTTPDSLKQMVAKVKEAEKSLDKNMPNDTRSSPGMIISSAA